MPQALRKLDARHMSTRWYGRISELNNTQLAELVRRACAVNAAGVQRSWLDRACVYRKL